MEVQSIDIAIGQASGESSFAVTLQPLFSTWYSSTVEKVVIMSWISYQQDQLSIIEQGEVEDEKTMVSVLLLWLVVS